jgi:hypothetical protein
MGLAVLSHIFHCLLYHCSNNQPAQAELLENREQTYGQISSDTTNSMPELKISQVGISSQLYNNLKS